MSPVPKPLVLLIIDGWGIAPDGPGNAITRSNASNIDNLWNSYPHTKLEASGEAVGLPHGEDGNTETGHLNIGAGRIVLQDLPRINFSIADGSFFENQAFKSAIDHLNKNNSNIHLLGLIGAGGVHSNLEHLFALMHLIKLQKIKNVFLHLFTDGRDSPPKSALNYIAQVNDKINETGIGKISSIMGRFYAMDRDYRWERTEKAYDTLTSGIGKQAFSAQEAITKSYESGKTDEFIEPTIILNNGLDPNQLIKSNDAVIFFNFRVDRPRQLTKAFVLPNFEQAAAKQRGFDPYAVKYFRKHLAYPELKTKPFHRKLKLQNLYFVTMTEYEQFLPVNVAYGPKVIDSPLGNVLSENNLSQLRISETEKERFVTYYFNGLREDPYPGEDRIIIPSAKVKTYDLFPQMSAPEITDTIIEHSLTGKYDVIITNYANADMVGHTGNLKATIDACQVVDGCISQVVEKILSLNGAIIITSDHGNAEELINLKTGEVDTEHSGFPVPFMLIQKSLENHNYNLPIGVLADIAPTMLKLLGIQKPSLMTGKSLI